MIRLHDIKISINDDINVLKKKCASKLHLKENDIQDLIIFIENHFCQGGSYTHHENRLLQKQSSEERQHFPEGGAVQNHHAHTGVHSCGRPHESDQIYHQRYGTGHRNHRRRTN